MDSQGDQGYRWANKWSIILSMTALLIFTGLVVAVDVLALKYGADSRRLHDGRPVL